MHDTASIARGAYAELARRSLRFFVREAWHVVEPGRAMVHGWHIDAIADHLQAVTRGEIENLLINIPPGHSKSTIVDVMWPAWSWIDWPEMRGLFSTYVERLSIRDSLRCRSVIESPWYQDSFRPSWRMAADQNAKGAFENTARGVRLALAVGSGTGLRGDILVCDDPLNAADQHSKSARDAAVFWWDNAYANRLNDMRKPRRVVIMQRLHEDDLSGHLLAQGGWEHLCLPSEFEPERRARTSIGWEDPRKAAGDLLFPAMFPAEVLAGEKLRLGSRGYAGQHMQRPSPPEGGMFKRDWWKRWAAPSGLEPAPLVEFLKLTEVIQSWDMTFKDTDGTDFVVGQVWGRREGSEYFLLDQTRARMDLPTTLDAVVDLTAKWPMATAKLVEDKANGPAVISSLRRKIDGLIPVEPDGGKIARAAAVTPLVEAGNVYLPPADYAPWIGDFIEELAQFPGSHDDQVDAASQALRRLGLQQEGWLLSS